MRSQEGKLVVERYRLPVRSLARELAKAPDGIADALSRGARRRIRDADFRARLDEPDAVDAAELA